MCHTLLEIPKKRANINLWLLFMKVINVSLSTLLLAARFEERKRALSVFVCVSTVCVCEFKLPQTKHMRNPLYLPLVLYLYLRLFVMLSECMTSACPLTHKDRRALIG